MRAGGCISVVFAALAGLAAGLVAPCAGPANAWAGDELIVALRDTRSGDSDAALATATAVVAADNSAKCGKCHSSCEYGRSHEGLVPTEVRAGGDLPLDAAGRTTCSTCHDSHRLGVKGVQGSHLRMANLQRELCLACHRRESQELPRVEIVSPLEGAVVREDRLALIGKVSQVAGAPITVRLNGSAFHLPAKGGEFFTWLKLQEGINRIEVAQEERLLWKGEVFFGESASGGYERISSGHRTGNREQCLGCHLKDGEMRAETRGPAPALCYGCHKRFDNKRYIHGPLAVGDCLACHDPHSGYGAAHLRKEQALLCRNCHVVGENRLSTACATAGKGCVDCHDPHQSDERYLLKGPQYTMFDSRTEAR